MLIIGLLIALFSSEVQSLTCHCAPLEENDPLIGFYNKTETKARYLEQSGRCNELLGFVLDQIVKYEGLNGRPIFKTEVYDWYEAAAEGIEWRYFCNNTWASQLMTGFYVLTQSFPEKGKCINGRCRVTKRMCQQLPFCVKQKMIPACSIRPLDCAFIAPGAQKYCTRNNCNAFATTGGLPIDPGS